MSANERERRAREYREAVERHLGGGEKVEAAAILERRYFEIGSDDFGLLHLLQRAYHRRRKGISALPDRFLLGVTQDQVYAFSYRTKRSKYEVKKQLACFRRKDISFSGKGSRWEDPRLEEITDGQTQRIPLQGAISEKRDPLVAEVFEALRQSSKPK